MSTPVGGLRARLIRESLFRMLHTAVTDLGWFAPGRNHSPLTFNSDPITDLREIAPNSAALADFDTNDGEVELGSLLTDVTWRFYVDMYAESEALGLHFSRDIKDILQGRMSSIGRTRPDFGVTDFTAATPSVIFFCEIIGVRVDRPITASKDHDKFWYTVRFDVVDAYATDLDT